MRRCGVSEARIIETADELDRLPGGAIVYNIQLRQVFERDGDDFPGALPGLTPSRWWTTAHSVSTRSDDVPLPARLLWHPGVDR